MSVNNLIKQAQNDISAKIIKYAEDRLSNINRGAETPRLAALLVEKYVWGCYETLHLLEEIGLKAISDEILKVGDSICNSIDPEFNKNKKLRWASRPADISSNASLTK